MKPWMKIAIPIALGVVAMYLNYVVGTSRLTPSRFVVVTQDFKPGDKFSDTNTAMLELYGAGAELGQTAIPYNNRASLYNQVCSRPLSKGDIVFWRDATPHDSRLDLRDKEKGVVLSLRGLANSLPKLVNVGTEIGFLAAPKKKTPPAPGSTATVPPATAELEASEYIGPFRVIGIGSRTSPEEAALVGGPTGENEVTVAVGWLGKGLDEKGQHLIEAQRANLIVGIVLEPPGEKGAQVQASK